MARKRFLEELKRRHVYRVAVAYVVVGWLLIQVATQVFPVFHLPDWIDQAVVLLIMVGFPIALVLAWAFDATPQGVVATDAAAEGGVASAPLRRRSRRAGITVGAIGVLVAVIAGAAYWHSGPTGLHAVPMKVAANEHPASSPVAAQRNPGITAPDSAAGAAVSGLRIATAPITAQPTPAKSIAVLPFENLSSNKDNAYFVAGMQDLILTKLADIGDLKVISRTSTESYASRPQNLKVVAQQLGVATILEGSVQRSGDRVLIDVQLIDAKTDSHIWAKSYTRTLHDLFGVEGEVAQSIAKTLDAKLTATEAARVARVPTTNSAALDAYLRGEYDMAAFNRDLVKSDVADAVRTYSDAVKLDPQFALAWAHLAHAQVFLHAMTFGNPAQSAQLKADAKASVARALALQPDLADAYMAQGIYDLYADGNQHAALPAFQKAHALQPQKAQISWWIGNALYGLGDTEGAIRAYKQAEALDPKRPPTQLAGAEIYLRHFAQAEVLYRRALALEPDSWVVVRSLAWLYSYLGDLPKMDALIENAAPAIKANPNFVDTVGRYLTYRRDWPAARKLYASAKEPENLRAAFYPIEVLRGDVEWYAGDKAVARAQYERALPLIQEVQKQHPESMRWHAELGWVYARLGSNTDALQQGRLALGEQDAAAEVVRHSPTGALALARIEAQIDRGHEAVSILDTLLAEPTGAYISVPLLKLDPTWDPIRHDPRFQALLKKYGNTQPAAAGSEARQ